ncbi:MAG TPA: hypothetical protein DGO89_24280, partial [Microcoleaceae bacterium UBA9251]|nr:hypothetical protein [Microcoleaceae cyanobacterium UBA9251]
SGNDAQSALATAIDGKNVRIFAWVGAGLLDCWFLAMIVGKTRPDNHLISGLPTSTLHFISCKKCTDFCLGGGGFIRLLVSGDDCW